MKAAQPINEVKPKKELLWRLSGSIESLVTSGGARWSGAQLVELLVNDEEAATGGFACVTFNRAVHCQKCAEAKSDCAKCKGRREYVERVTVWLTVPVNAADGVEVEGSIWPLKWVEPLRFVIRRTHD